MSKAIMVLNDGQSYVPVDGCRIVLCPDNVTDQQIQQTLQQINQGNLQALISGQYSVATRFTETQGSGSFSSQGNQGQNQPVALIEAGHFTLATRFDPSQTQGSQQSQLGSSSSALQQGNQQRPQW